MSNQASERLKRCMPKIMKSWEERAKKEITAALHQESLALQDSLPEYLNQMVTALSTQTDRSELRRKFDLEETGRLGRKHGRERATNHKYTMDQLILEYHILRQVICDVVEEEAILSPVEREIIVCSIEQAVNDAATQFSATLHDVQEYLTRTLAHDLRSPITSAKLGAQFIVKHHQEAALVLKTAHRIDASMERLDSMIQDLLNASLLDSGKTAALKFSHCDLNLICQGIVDEFNFVYPERFQFHSSGSVLGFWSASGLNRVIENLASNAAKYSEPGTPILVSLQSNSQTATVIVHNEGKAIPVEEQSLLFEQFERSKSAEGKIGWGLGLSVVKGITEAHQGTVRLISTPEQGTSFSIELPLDSRVAAKAE